ncbi:MAG TPA: hypothetical protein VEK09_11495, partial [Jatrophihabitantaceae bacterium]|nr:hypothetical protein [Jatrophihabitantaceae bacterium]
IADPAAGERTRFASQSSFVDHLAEVVPTRSDSLLAAVPQLRAAMRDSTVVAVLGRVDDASVHALAEAHPRGSATPAFAMLLDVDSWYNAGAGDQAAAEGASPAPGTIWTAESRRVAETLRAAGWCVVPARAGDSVPSVWTRLLRQRAAAPGSSATLAAPRLTTLQ